jgi:hypothetical protein
MFGSELKTRTSELIRGGIFKYYSVLNATVPITGKMLIKFSYSIYFISSLCSAHFARRTCILHSDLSTHTGKKYPK